MPDRFAFLRSGRWIGLAVGALVVSVACVFLGRWQWQRYEARVAAVEQVDANWDAPVAGIEELLADGLTVGATDQWQQVRLTGRWVPDSTVLLRNRPVAGNPALHAVGVFLADRDDGDPVAVVVSRGWLPADTATTPGLPSGEQEVVVRVRVEEGPVDREPPAGQVYTLNTAQVVAATGLDLATATVQGYGQVVDPVEPLLPFPEPDRDLGSHLSYAFQWWFFAAAVPVGVVVLARREAEEVRAGPRPKRRRDDEVAEDALIDAQLAAQASETSSA